MIERDRDTALPSAPAGGCACGTPVFRPATLGKVDAHWTDGVVVTKAGDVPRVRTTLGSRDRVGAFKARVGVGRMDYRVEPGLYAAGDPGPESPVLVSANYKLSFDHLRAVLAGRAAWILVLDTDGINVWCAAGKGTFGTDEIVRRVQGAALDRIVSHKRLVVPQFGAPGVSAHLVKQRCGFRVVYGPVRAEDLPAFLDAGMKAQPSMRRVQFTLRDRAVLIPVELVMGAKYVLIAAAALLLLGGLGHDGYSLAGVSTAGLAAALTILVTFVLSAVLGPMLLPWLPGRAFSLKGAALGFAFAAPVAAWTVSHGANGLPTAAWMLAVTALASFVVMNFTGASTFTSLSGVLREMRVAIPLQIAALIAGLGLWVAGLFAATGGAA